jgi:hypothetical protein
LEKKLVIMLYFTMLYFNIASEDITDLQSDLVDGVHQEKDVMSYSFATVWK